MKKLSYLYVAILIISLSGCSLFQGGSDTFEGYIKYDIDYEGDIDEAIRAQLPTSVTDYYKGAKIRKEQETAMFSMYQIVNSAKKEVIILMDMMGQKFAYKQDSAKMQEAMKELGEPEVRETGETKKILGYTTKKVEVELDDNIFFGYVTDEINQEADHNWAGQFNGVKGVLLEYTTEQQGIIMTFTAKEIKEEKVKPSKFTIPAEYELKTSEEISTMFGG
ncbi:MAG: hypothetical protein ACP5DZ_09915 [Bacteroidales bacterium]